MSQARRIDCVVRLSDTSVMKFEIVDDPFHVELVGKRGAVENHRYGEVGRRLMDAMWSEVRRLKLPNVGLNHWVYLPNHELFTGVELSPPAADIGSLDALRVDVGRRLQHVHRGPYTELPAVWKSLFDELKASGEKSISPGLEIYGHWTDDTTQLTTTILIALAARGA